MDERAAFERNIDENPLDATNHLVYADWLDENGHPDEAAFRRAMGEWVGRGPTEIDYFKPPSDEPKSFHAGEPSEDTPEGPGGFTHMIRYPKDLPSWADGVQRTTRHPVVTGQPHIALQPNQYWLHWRGYRNMEEGLRRAFMANRSARQSRRTYSRRTGRIYR